MKVIILSVLCWATGIPSWIQSGQSAGVDREFNEKSQELSSLLLRNEQKCMALASFIFFQKMSGGERLVPRLSGNCIEVPSSLWGISRFLKVGHLTLKEKKQLMRTITFYDSASSEVKEAVLQECIDQVAAVRKARDELRHLLAERKRLRELIAFCS